MSELKRCPFCGGEAIFHEYEAVDLFTVRCKECVCSTHSYFSESKAILAWNRRAPDMGNPATENDHIGEANKMITNADRIRAMSEEELADVVFGKCQIYGTKCTELDKNCADCTLAWLCAEAKEKSR